MLHEQDDDDGLSFYSSYNAFNPSEFPKNIEDPRKSSTNQIKQTDRELWNELIEETENIKKEVAKFKLANIQVLEDPPHVIIDYLNETVFPVLDKGLMKMLKKIKSQENEIFTEGDVYLNSLNFLSEYLWNMNPCHPKRRENWTEISNIVWK